MSKHWWAKMILETRCSIGGRIAHAFFTIPAIRIPSDVTRRKSATEDIGLFFSGRYPLDRAWANQYRWL